MNTSDMLYKIRHAVENKKMLIDYEMFSDLRQLILEEYSSYAEIIDNVEIINYVNSIITLTFSDCSADNQLMFLDKLISIADYIDEISSREYEGKRIDSYSDYEALGDTLIKENVNQSFLCYENAEFLCADFDEKQRIRKKKEQVLQDYPVEVKPVSIIIVSYNCCYLMQKCIEGIREHCCRESYEIIVVDNASEDGVREWLMQQKDIKLLALDENIGFPAGCNAGICKSKTGNDIFLLNNDTRLTENALFWLRMGLYSQECIGAAGCVANYCGNIQRVESVGDSIDECLRYAKYNNNIMDAPYEERPRLCGFAMLIKREALDKTKGLDERLTPGYFDDDDISLQIRALGYRMIICHNSFIYHAGSQSFSNRNDLEQIGTRNRQYMIEKYGFDVPAYCNPNEDAIRKIEKDRYEQFSVLEINAGCGATLSRIKYLYPNANVYGVEKNDNARKYAVEGITIVPDESDIYQKEFDIRITSQL